MSKLQDVKIGKKLGGGFGILAVLLLGMSVAAIWGLATMNNLKEQIVSESKKTTMAAGVRDNVLDIDYKVAAIVLSRDTAHKVEIQGSLAPVRAQYAKQMEELKAMAVTQEDREKLTAIEDAIAGARNVNNKLVELAMADKDEEAAVMFTASSAPLMAKINSSVDDLRTWRDKQMAGAVMEAQSLYSTLRWLLILGGGLAILIAAFFGVFLTRSIVGPIRQGVEFAAAISKGDMTQVLKIDQKDEIGQLAKALNEMGANVHRMIADINSGVQTLASSSTKLSAISSQMASGTEDISERATTVAAAAEESNAAHGPACGTRGRPRAQPTAPRRCAP